MPVFLLVPHVLHSVIGKSLQKVKSTFETFDRVRKKGALLIPRRERRGASLLEPESNSNSV
jgi:hypothetical protein